MAAVSQNLVRKSFCRFLAAWNQNGQKVFNNGCRPFADSAVESKEKISKAMKAYLKRAQAHEEFMKQEQHQYNVGRRHLANMMGADPDTFTQEDIDKSIQYLLPSALYEPTARPVMKPPEQVFPKTKAAEFDETGRPYHYLFYTTRPNYAQLLHESSDVLADLDKYENQMIRQQRKPDPEQALNLMGSEWLKKEKFEKMIVEKLVDIEFDNFINVLERIAAHPYGYRAKDFLFQYRIQLMTERKQIELEPQIDENGRRFVTFNECIRKSTRGSVTLTEPGTGKFTINGKGIEYFQDDTSRQQVLFPLIFTGFLGKVDIDVKMEHGGATGQAGATRYGISMCLKAFVAPAVVEEMRLAGLLTRDVRRRERKKPGQEGARRKYTWKKR